LADGRSLIKPEKKRDTGAKNTTTSLRQYFFISVQLKRNLNAFLSMLVRYFYLGFR